MADLLYDMLAWGLICVFLLYYNAPDSRRGEPGGASAPMQEEMMVFESTGAVSHSLIWHVAFFRAEHARGVYSPTPLPCIAAVSFSFC